MGDARSSASPILADSRISLQAMWTIATRVEQPAFQPLKNLLPTPATRPERDLLLSRGDRGRDAADRPTVGQSIPYNLGPVLPPLIGATRHRLCCDEIRANSQSSIYSPNLPATCRSFGQVRGFSPLKTLSLHRQATWFGPRSQSSSNSTRSALTSFAHSLPRATIHVDSEPTEQA
jgi:hypothetical protein